MTTPIFDFDKALNAFLYVANRVTEQRDIHKLFKILYFADMSHLHKYGRPITGDSYIAMTFGPVPSGVYDMVKIVRGDGWWVKDDLKAFFSIHNNKILVPLRDADMAVMSKTDAEELDSAIERYQTKGFRKMTEVSHGFAWQSAIDARRGAIALEDILRECGADDDYISFIVEGIAAQKEMCR